MCTAYHGLFPDENYRQEVQFHCWKTEETNVKIYTKEIMRKMSEVHQRKRATLACKAYLLINIFSVITNSSMHILEELQGC